MSKMHILIAAIIVVIVLFLASYDFEGFRGRRLRKPAGRPPIFRPYHKYENIWRLGPITRVIPLGTCGRGL